MSTKCAKCGKNMDAAPYSKAHNALVCPSCGYLLRMETLTRGEERASRPEVPLPQGMTISSGEGVLILRARWFERGYLILALFTLLFDGALALWYTSLLGLDAVGVNYYSLSPVIHLVASVILTWYTLACLFDTSVISISTERIVVRHRPFPWFGGMSLPAHQLDQLWSERQEKVAGEPLYHVRGQLRNGRTFNFLYGLHNPSQALYIEQEIEHFLGIVDRPVPGAM